MRGDDSQQSYLLDYDYDAYGNRSQKSLNNQNNPVAQHWVEGGSFDPLTNRFTSGVTYDAAGNVTSDSRFRHRSFLYDANGRQRRSSKPDGTGAVVSVYDGAGQRVATKAGGHVTNVLVYDAAGKLVAEYGQSVSAAGTQYVMGDHQGSTRVVMNATGANGGVVSRRDYLPFGEEVSAGVGMRSAAQGYGQADGVRQKYAGMEGDEATGMSHTLWREFDSSSARWTSPDPYGGSMELASPQTFNRYTYVNNDPVNKVDPTGLMLSDIGVVQTNDAGYAHTLQGASDAAWMNSINRQYAEERGLVVVQEQKEGGGYNYRARDHATVAAYAEIEAALKYSVSVNVLDDSEGGAQYGSTVHGFNLNAVMVIIWGKGGINPFGHVSYITMDDDMSYSWEGVVNWTKDSPSAKYTDLRSKTSAGMGYVLDFGPEVNAKFQKALIDAYTSRLGFNYPYRPMGNNCGMAFNVAFNVIRKDIGMNKRINFVAPLDTMKFINANLRQYIKGQRLFPKH